MLLPMESPPRQLRRSIGLGSAVALYSGAVLGSGMLVLPGTAAETAGPASLVAWLGLCVLSLPLALTFASLARRQPIAGGFSAYIVRAFGPSAGRAAGWLFLAQIPMGAAFVSLLAASYLGAPFDVGREGSFLIAGAVLVVAYALNLAGLRLAGGVQLAATAGVLLLVAVVVAASIPRASVAAFTPFAPLGWPAVGVAATQLFWAFVGWEAITPLAQEFRDPARDVRRASLLSVGLVALIYLALAAVTVGTRSYGAAGLPSFAQMAEGSFGAGAVLVVGIAGGILCFTPLNAYVAGTSRLAFALAGSGDLPAWLDVLSAKARVPHRAILALGALSLSSLAATYVLGLRPSDLLPFSTSAFLATYVLSMAAGVRLLRGREALLAAVGLVACVGVLFFTGAHLLWIASVFAVAVLYRRRPMRRTTDAREGALAHEVA
jgi:amino acid efflux transporter